MIIITPQALDKMCTLPYPLSKYASIYLEKVHGLVTMSVVDAAIEYGEGQTSLDSEMGDITSAEIEASIANDEYISIIDYIAGQKSQMSWLDRVKMWLKEWTNGF